MHKNILTGEWKVSDLNIKKDWIFELQENDQKELIDATNQAIKSKKDKKLVSINIIGKKNKISSQDQLRFKALEEGTFFARDLVSEPGNILHPDEYAKRINTCLLYSSPRPLD